MSVQSNKLNHEVAVTSEVTVTSEKVKENHMIERIFPQTVSNRYQGHGLAKWLLIFYVAKSFVAGSIHMFAADGGAQSIASITLDQFTQGGADSVVTMLGLVGMEQFVIGIIGAIILWRYKALIPMMALIYVIEYIGRFTAHLYTPGLATAHTPPGVAMDNILVPLALVMLALSLWERKNKLQLQ